MEKRISRGKNSTKVPNIQDLKSKRQFQGAYSSSLSSVSSSSPLVSLAGAAVLSTYVISITS